MDVVENLKKVQMYPNLVLTLGSFDGVHLGHQRILAELMRVAQKNGKIDSENTPGTTAVMTFRPHPREFFSAKHAPNLLTTEQKKLELLDQSGVDVVFILPFDEKIAHLDPSVFVEEIIVGACHARALVIGHDFHFGRDAQGNYDLLCETGTRLGFQVMQVPPFIIQGERVSSTAIRERLLEGDLDKAETFLGRKYSVRGEVIEGRGIGVSLGFPTANILPHHSAVPAQGVYAAEILINGRCYPGAVNIGIAPTLKNEGTIIEAFLINFDENIRGRTIEVVFHKRLRPEKKFPSPEALAEAIHRDVETIRTYFAGAKGNSH